MTEYREHLNSSSSNVHDGSRTNQRVKFSHSVLFAKFKRYIQHKNALQFLNITCLHCVNFKRRWKFQWISKVPYCSAFVLFKESKLKVANHRVVNVQCMSFIGKNMVPFSITRTKSRIIQFISSFHFWIHLIHVIVKSTIVVRALFWVFQFLLGIFD